MQGHVRSVGSKGTEGTAKGSQAPQGDMMSQETAGIARGHDKRDGIIRCGVNTALPSRTPVKQEYCKTI